MSRPSTLRLKHLGSHCQSMKCSYVVPGISSPGIAQQVNSPDRCRSSESAVVVKNSARLLLPPQTVSCTMEASYSPLKLFEARDILEVLHQILELYGEIDTETNGLPLLFEYAKLVKNNCGSMALVGDRLAELEHIELNIGPDIDPQAWYEHNFMSLFRSTQAIGLQRVSPGR